MLYRFAHAAIGAPLHADVGQADAEPCRSGALAGTMSYYTAKIEEDGNIAPFVPFLLAFGILGIVMSVLIVANVVGGAVVSGYRRIGILKSIGFTPVQVAAAYAAQVAATGPRRLPRSGSRSATCSQLRSFDRTPPPTASVGSAFRSGSTSPYLPGSAPSLPSLRCCRRSEPGGSAPSRRSRPAARRKAGAATQPTGCSAACRFPRPITIGLAAPFARPSRTAADARRRPARRDGGHVRRRTDLVPRDGCSNGISHKQAEPMQIQMPGNGFEGGPKQVKIGPKHLKAGPPTTRCAAGPDRQSRACNPGRGPRPAGHTPRRRRGRCTPRASPGLSEQVPLTAFRGAATWTGYDLVSGHWYTGPGPGARPNRLPHTDRNVGRRHDLSLRRAQTAPRPDRRRDLRHPQPRPQSRHELGDPPHARPRHRPRPVRRRPAARNIGRRVRERARPRLGSDYAVELNTRNTAVVDAMIGLIGTLAALLAAVAALGVLNTVVLETRERVHDIGIFKAVGMTPRQTTAMAISWVAAHRPRRGRHRRPTRSRAPPRDPPGHGRKRRAAPTGELPRRLQHAKSCSRSRSPAC